MSQRWCISIACQLDTLSVDVLYQGKKSVL